MYGPVAVFAAAGLVLAGCASDGDDPAEPTDSPDTTETADGGTDPDTGGGGAEGCEAFEVYGTFEGDEVEVTVAEDGDVWAFLTPSINEGDGAAVTGGGEFVAAFNDNPATAALQAYLSSDTWANERVSIGGVISANTGLDPANAGSEIGRASIEILQGEDTIFRFDASDLMPAQVGASSFWTGMNDYVSGTSLDTVLSNIENSW